MKLEKFIEVIEEQFDDIEAGMFKADTDFRDNDEWDSLIALGIIAGLDSEFGASITADELSKTETIQELYDLVNNKLV
jgi:acyl carrier protein